MKPVRPFSLTLLWSSMVVVIVAVIAAGILTNSTLRSIEKKLPNTLLTELRDLAQILNDLAKIVSTAEITQVRPNSENFTRLRREVKTVYDGVVTLRHTYVFDNLVQASAFHTVIAPAIADLQIWLSEGVSGYGPETATTINIALSRISQAFHKARAMNYDSQITALKIMNEQRSRLDQFLFSVNLLFMLTLVITIVMVFLLIRQHVLQRREAEAHVERRRFEQSLRESEERFRTVLEANPDPVVVYDMTGNVIFFNPAFTKVFGWTLDECLGKRMDMFVPEESWTETRRMIEKVLAGKSISGSETRRLTKDGDIISISLSAAVYHNKDGNPVGSVINLRDISEQKKLEAELQRAQKMEAIGTLAGGVAHDLNNILSGIVSYPELLLLDLPQDSPFKEPILAIQKSGEKAAAIVQDLLTLARRGVAIKEVVNLNHIISEYFKSPEYDKLKSFHPNVQVETRIEDDILKIEGSSVHLETTIMNLVSNAAEAIVNEGKVTISTKNRYIDKPIRGYDEVKEGDYVVLNVADNGIGFSPEDMGRIFEPFYTKKAMGRSGTGLGMAVVWGTVKDHEGYIDVKSTEGKGTTFTLYFPITRKEIAKDELLLPMEDYMGHGESILIVDDAKEQRELVSVMLRKLGYSVASVSSGEEAIKYMKNNSADLLVLDMIMYPGINGRETYERIIKFHPEQKAIIASGFSETVDVKKAQELGAGQYIKKPYTLEKIGIAVRNELKK